MSLLRCQVRKLSISCPRAKDYYDLPFEPRSVFEITPSPQLSSAVRKDVNRRLLGAEKPSLASVPSDKSVVNNKPGVDNAVKTKDSGVNTCGIQMLSEELRKAVFPDVEAKRIEQARIEKIKAHLQSHDLWGRKSDILPEVNIKMPELQGVDINAHFTKLAVEQTASYVKLLTKFLECEMPPLPAVWEFKPGWTRYGHDGSVASVSYPQENIYVFDIEVCVCDGKFPTLAVAISDSAFYLWCSDRLITGKSVARNYYTLDDMIPLESSSGKVDKQERLVIGHNVGFDRTRVKEQYFLEETPTRFLDTMSLHIAVGGITSYQRNVLMAAQNGGEVKKTKGQDNSVLDWLLISSRNGLSDVHKLYCGSELDKEARNYFVTGTLDEVRENFQNLATYCAKDCIATFKILKELMPIYFERFPHPVTFAGMLEMGTSILPVSDDWNRYIESSEASFLEMETILRRSLAQQAQEAVQSMNGAEYAQDPWLFDLDWSTQDLKVKKIKSKKRSQDTLEVYESPEALVAFEYDNHVNENFGELVHKFSTLMDSEANLYKRSQFMPGYPQWFRDLCTKFPTLDGFVYGPHDMSTSLQVVPKILKLTWCGYPLYYVKDFGWGYLVPGRNLENSKCVSADGEKFPLDVALQLFPPGVECLGEESRIQPDDILDTLRTVTAGLVEEGTARKTWEELRASIELKPFVSKEKKKITPDKPSWHSGIGPYDVGVPGCWFFRLPHKDSGDKNVGNPLAKDYMAYIESKQLRSQVPELAEKLLKSSKAVNFWKMYRDRIVNQLVVSLDKTALPKFVQKADGFDQHSQYGVILPMTVVAGTLTRRAVEATWMTASNAYRDRIGSELKSMVQAPPGYHLVGADVDSQELWIASVIGDAHFAGEHGSTAFGWMTLQGKKSDGTDMHSRTAATVSITRDQAKVLNYGRIYGAGETFARSLLKQFNPKLTDDETLEKAKKMYSKTKGIKAMELSDAGKSLFRAAGMNPNKPVTWEEIREAKAVVRRLVRDEKLPFDYLDLCRCKTMDLVHRKIWRGGTESHMFNKLEEIVEQPEPRTPVLGCRITRALDPVNVGQSFMTSRVNWVVQSSAVDYLHLMLVSMRYLFNKFAISGRFCISIHDEVRYLVRSEDRYRAALALHITNLWTRAMFSHKLGMNNLPQSVAFFSSVDIDKVLRKEVNMDCKTPSNPLGLAKGYQIPYGESLDVYKTVQLTGGSLEKPK